MASRRTILILFSVLSAFVVSSKGASTTAGAASTSTSLVPSTTAGGTSSPPVSVDDSSNSTAGTTVASGTPEPSTTAVGNTEGFDDLALVDYIIIGVTCAVCLGIAIGAIIVYARKRMRKDKGDTSSLVNHGHHPEHITELGDGVKNYTVEQH